MIGQSSRAVPLQSDDSIVFAQRPKKKVKRETETDENCCAQAFDDTLSYNRVEELKSAPKLSDHYLYKYRT